MVQKLYSKNFKKTIQKSFSFIEGILPFTQKPSDNHFVSQEDKNENVTEMKADDLFSLFTADIIKEEIVFTR